MSYTDIEKQQKSQHESYLRNKEKVLAQSKKRKKENHDRNIRFTNKYKIMCGCTACGFKVHPRALEFHHIQDDKESGISRMLRHVKLLKLKVEIRKCVVLCANCHRLVHEGVIKVKGKHE